MYRAAVIGDRDSIYGFAALGLDVFPVEDGDAGSKPCAGLRRANTPSSTSPNVCVLETAKGEENLSLMQKWTVRVARPYDRKFTPRSRL